MQHYLESRCLSFNLAVENGWYPSTVAGDIWGRIVIPATSKIPGNYYWQARAIQKGIEPRYQSPCASRGDAIVVVWPGQRVTRRQVGCVVEGPMDALAAAGVGCVGIALMGVMPPEAALALTATFLRRVETLLESKNPQAAFDAAFDLLDTINVQMEVVVEAATLVQYGLSLEERAKSLPFTGDALEGLMVQRLKLRGIIEKPDSRVSEDLRPIEAELLELDRLIQSTQDVKSQSVERENRGPKRGKRQRKTERREYDRDWRSRLPRIDEDELPDNVRLLRVS